MQPVRIQLIRYTQEEIVIVPSASIVSMAAQENHTLGNALRHVLLMNPRVMFAGYSMPHPFEDQMHLRIQTAEDYPAQEALKQALQDLKSLAAISKQKFLDAVSEYKQDHPDCMKTES